MKYILILLFVIGCESKTTNIQNHSVDTVYVTDGSFLDTTIYPIKTYRVGDTFFLETDFRPALRDKLSDTSLYTRIYDSLGNVYFKEK